MDIETEYTSLGPRMIGQIHNIKRCPHCQIAEPNLECVWSSPGPTPRRDGGERYCWGVFLCQSCGAIVSVCGDETSNGFIVLELIPRPKFAHEDIPDIARRYLQQAIETLHAPDAAAVMAAAAVDAMLKHKSYTEGSLYARIDKALKDNLLTKGMADWAHSVRLGSNRPRHADAENPHVSSDEAKQSVDFAEALGNFLFVLTAQIERGLQAAKPDNANSKR